MVGSLFFKGPHLDLSRADRLPAHSRTKYVKPRTPSAVRLISTPSCATGTWSVSPPGTCSMKILMNPFSLMEPRYWTMFLCFRCLWRAISSWSGWEYLPSRERADVKKNKMAKSGLSKIGSQTFSAAPSFGRLDYNMVPLEQKKK